MEDRIKIGMIQDENNEDMEALLPEKDGRYSLFHINVDYNRQHVEDVKLLEIYFGRKLSIYANKTVEFYVTRNTTDFSLIAVLNCLIKYHCNARIYFWNEKKKEYQGIDFETNMNVKNDNNTYIPYVLLHRHDVGISEEMSSALEQKNIVYKGGAFSEDRIPSEYMFDFEMLTQMARASLQEARDKLEKCGGNTVKIYMCGLKQLTVIAINEAHRLGLHVICMHWNKDREQYFLQDVE